MFENILKDYDSNIDILSEESKEATKELVNYISDHLRFEYDKFVDLLNDEDFKKTSKEYIEIDKVKDLKTMLSHLSDLKITVFNNEVKEKFVDIMLESNCDYYIELFKKDEK